jgi:hypothetical protein
VTASQSEIRVGWRSPCFVANVAFEERAEALTPEIEALIDAGRTLLGWGIAVDNIEGVAARLGCEIEAGAITRDDGTTGSWRMVGSDDCRCRSSGPAAPYDDSRNAMNLFRFIPGYETHIHGGGREPSFLMLLAFILTLAGTRFYTRMARLRGWGSAHVGDVHVHHLVPGIVLSLVAGGIVIGLAPGEPWLAFLAIVFGAGAALVLDEFAMLLHLDDVYWTTEGRLSIEACMAAVAFLGLAVLATFPLPTDRGSERLARWLGDGLIALVAIFVMVTLLKGKLKLGLFGIVFVPLSVVGAVRLAKPGSVWARRFYPEDGKLMRRSEARAATRDERWSQRRERFYDLIGGTPHLGSNRDSKA